MACTRVAGGDDGLAPLPRATAAAVAGERGVAYRNGASRLSQNVSGTHNSSEVITT